MPDLHYTHPRLAEIYDLGNSGAEDRDFYIAQAGPPPQAILDLGCGTGLVCHAYAALGHRVTGVDPAAAMLKVAKHGPHGSDIRWVQANAETFRTKSRFDLIIMTGHAFQVLLSDAQVSAAFRTMAHHLKPDGHVVFESRNPNIDWDKRWALDRRLPGPNGDIHAQRRLLGMSDDGAYISFAWDYNFGDEVLTSESTLRFLSHEEIIRFAAAAGLELSMLYGDWNHTPFNAKTSPEMIFKFRRSDALDRRDMT